MVDLIKEYNTLGRNCVAIMLDTKGPEVRSGDLSAPIDLVTGVQNHCILQTVAIGRNLPKGLKYGSWACRSHWPKFMKQLTPAVHGVFIFYVPQHSWL